MKRIIGIVLASLFLTTNVFAEPDIPPGAGLEPLEAGLELKIAIFCPGKESAHYDIYYTDDRLGRDVLSRYHKENVRIQIDSSIKKDVQIYYFGKNIRLVFRDEKVRDKKVKRSPILPCPGLDPPPFSSKPLQNPLPSDFPTLPVPELGNPLPV